MASNMKSITASITVDDGARRVAIVNTQGDEIGAFTFRPTDIGIIERFNRMAAEFDAIVEPLEILGEKEDKKNENKDPAEGQSEGENAGGPEDGVMAAALKEAERRLNLAVNALFGSDDAASAFFGRLNPFSPVNGEFYCAQVLRQVGAFIGDQFDVQTRLLALGGGADGRGAGRRRGQRRAAHE